MADGVLGLDRGSHNADGGHWYDRYIAAVSVSAQKKYGGELFLREHEAAYLRGAAGGDRRSAAFRNRNRACYWICSDPSGCIFLSDGDRMVLCCDCDSGRAGGCYEPGADGAVLSV